jgi:hypothetical protein
MANYFETGKKNTCEGAGGSEMGLLVGEFPVPACPHARNEGMEGGMETAQSRMVY